MTSRKAVSKEVQGAYDHILAALAARRDVTGVDIGYKYTDGVKTRQLAVRVHVEKKRSKRSIAAPESVPKQVRGVLTDVIQARYRRHGGSESEPWQRQSVVRPGLSIGNAKADAGTLGLIVTDDATGDPCLLSSFHVLVGAMGEVGDEITQPARFDHGFVPGDTIGTLLRFFQPGSWGDAAIAKLNRKRAFAIEQFESAVRIKSVGLPSLGQVLEKSGRTTGVTRGTVDGMGTYFYSGGEQGVGGFRLVPAGEDNPERQDLSAVGDSGSVYYDPASRAGVGLHCAGDVDSPGQEFAIACYLGRVMDTLGVSLA